MNTKSEEPKPSENKEFPMQESSTCGPGCSCQTNAPSSRIRWIVGVIVLIAVGVLVARAIVKDKGVSAIPGFANVAATGETPSPTALPANEASVAVKDKDVSATPGSANATTAGETPSPEVPAANQASMAVKEIGALSDLNAVAADTNMVFVFLPGKTDTPEKAPLSQMIGAARTIQSKGLKTGLFSLTTDSPDYKQVTARMAAPVVLAMVKGRGMQGVSGEITETNLIQAYVAASSAGSGCGASAGPGCCPK